MKFYTDDKELNGYSESEIIKFANGMSLWSIFNGLDNTKAFQVSYKGDVIKSYNRLEPAKAFIEGMEKMSIMMGEGKFEQFPEDNNKEDITTIVFNLRKENAKLEKQKDQAQKLAGKMVKGIMKDKGQAHKEKMTEIMVKYADEL